MFHGVRLLHHTIVVTSRNLNELKEYNRGYLNFSLLPYNRLYRS